MAREQREFLRPSGGEALLVIGPSVERNHPVVLRPNETGQTEISAMERTREAERAKLEGELQPMIVSQATTAESLAVPFILELSSDQGWHRIVAKSRHP